jgi:LPXTG-site transpeptidase (sortase) family protein
MSKVVAGLGLAAFVAIAALFAPPRGDIILPSATPFVAPTSSASSAASAAPVPIPPGYRIQIPRLGIDLPIAEGDVGRDTVQQQTPENYAFHLPGTAIPGTGANSYLYAHARRGMFLSLWDARVGDVVWISTPDGRTLRYVVTEVHPSVPPGDVSWTAPSPPDRLTLQTSTGPNPGDPRFVVIAQPS